MINGCIIEWKVYVRFDFKFSGLLVFVIGVYVFVGFLRYEIIIWYLGLL